MWEDLYVRRYEAKSQTQELLSPASHTEYKSALEQLYRSILKYQVTSYDYYIRNSAFRLGLDMIKWDDWEGLLDEIREQERGFIAVSAMWRDMKYDEEQEAASRRHLESVDRLETIESSVQGLRQEVQDAQADSNRAALLKWLCEVDPSVIYNIAREKHEGGTSDWLLQGNTAFKIWQKSPGSMLWLHGKGIVHLSSSPVRRSLTFCSRFRQDYTEFLGHQPLAGSPRIGPRNGTCILLFQLHRRKKAACGGDARVGRETALLSSTRHATADQGPRSVQGERRAARYLDSRNRASGDFTGVLDCAHRGRWPG